ncbi:MAG: hypothetical protein DRN81_06385, partial [Thermoproteota archaeon]
MVKLLSIQANNFKKLKLSKPLKLPEGMVLISGENESGKSTLLDAILYALFGRVIRPRNARNDEIVSYGSKKAFVSLEFQIGDRRFLVTREINLTRPSEARLVEFFPDGSPKILAIGVRQVTKEVEKLLGGITFDEMVSSNVLAQKDLARLVEKGKEDRKKAINAFLNLESFNMVRDKFYEEVKQLAGTRGGTGQLQFEEDKLRTLLKQLEQYKETEKLLKEMEDELARKESDLTRLRSELASLKKRFESLQKYGEAVEQLSRLEAMQQEKKKHLEELVGRIEQLRRASNELEKYREELKQYSGIEVFKKTLDRLQENVSQRKEVISKIKTYVDRKNTLESDVKQREEILPKIEFEEMEKLRKKIIPQKLLVLTVVTPLSISLFLVVTNMLSQKLGVVLLAISIIILPILTLYNQKKQEKLFKLESEHQKYLSEKKALETQIDEIRRIEAEMSTLEKQLYTLSNQTNQILGDLPREAVPPAVHPTEDPEELLEELRRWYEQKLNQKNRLEERIATLKKGLSQLTEEENRKNRVEKEIDEIEEKIRRISLPTLPPGIQFSGNILRETQEKKERIEQAIAKIDGEISFMKRRIVEMRSYLEENRDIEKKVGEQEEKVQRLRHRLKVAKLCVEAIDKTAETLRARIRPQVEQYMGLILPAITNNRYKAVQLDEDYNLKVWDPEAGEFRPRDVFSGGTEDQFLLSMRLAFALALLPEAKGSHPRFLFLDEPLGSSDEIRREGILELLSSQLLKTFDQIFLISHVYGEETTNFK